MPLESQELPHEILSAAPQLSDLGRSGRDRGLGAQGILVNLSIDLGNHDFSMLEELDIVLDAGVSVGGRATKTLNATTRVVVSPLPNPAGWHAGDAHIHTNWSDGWLDLDRTVQHARNVSGLAWMVLAEHSPKIHDRWDKYVTACADAQQAHDVLVCPGAEFATGGSFPGHALGYALSVDNALPDSTDLPQDVIDSIRTQGSSSFAAIAHPYHWLYDWPDWNVREFHAMELATGGGRHVDDETRSHWFQLLRQDLQYWKDHGGSPSFVVGLAGTDSHSIPLFVMPGERHMTWVRMQTETRRDEAADLFSHIRAGHCVASCGGDFAAFSVNEEGPGEACSSDGTAPLLCGFEAMPRAGHRLKAVRLLGENGEVLRAWDTVDGAPFNDHIAAPAKSTFYVAQFLFSGHWNRPWEVWTNPVWVKRS